MVRMTERLPMQGRPNRLPGLSAVHFSHFQPISARDGASPWVRFLVTYTTELV